ncbi:unnamed protein product [Nyctereutes procyonoides]|uniref:Cytochrome c oxidase subunit 7B, mitochondrial n=1 Tax=Nyctereutes procyonoides TaxID=34880 RepID=A0A811YZ83_NYCPR|nr:unnamed protein product [Nyctereutes procyonoides]
MFPVAPYCCKSSLQSPQQTMARQGHQNRTPDFHDKYGNDLFARKATFCVVVWAHTATQIGVGRNLSPVGRVTPQRKGKNSNQPSWCNTELFQNQLLNDAK